jgi:excisionase family DNA binding protein
MALSDLVYMSVDEVAEYVRVRKDSVARLVKAGMLPAPVCKFGPRKARWYRPDVDKAMGVEPPEKDTSEMDSFRAQLEAKSKKRHEIWKGSLLHKDYR